VLVDTTNLLMNEKHRGVDVAFIMALIFLRLFQRRWDFITSFITCGKCME